MNELSLLLLSAASLGIGHTLLGPDHYLPFIVLSKARSWSRGRTLWITFISGLGHVGSSVILGAVGIALGVSLHRLEAIEAGRGNLVGWMLILFGGLYTIYGIFKYVRRGGHVHLPAFLRPKAIRHRHLGIREEDVQENAEDVAKLTPWILFLIFVFGPCEVLIPVLMFPAAEMNGMGIALVAIVFGIATVGTMLFVVLLGYQGVSLVRLKGREHVMHLVAGLVILSAGLGMQFLGL